MVQGLRSRRPLVKFRRVLPLAAVLFVSLATVRYFSAVPRIVRTPGGAVFAINAHRTRPAVISTAINLPAFVVALPLELAIFRSNPRSNRYYELFRTVEFSLLGIIFWFSAGRAIDDWIAWRALRSGARWRLSDCLMAGLVALECTMLAALFSFGFKRSRPESWYLASSIAWALLGYWSLIFRVVQFRTYPHITTRRGATDA